MTTRVILVSDPQSNPAQEVVVTKSDVNGASTQSVLSPGTAWDSGWFTDYHTITITERQKVGAPATGAVALEPGSASSTSAGQGGTP